MSEPFNLSVSEIRGMTMPMIKNLLKVFEESDPKPTSAEEFQRAMGMNQKASQSPKRR